MTMTMPHPKHHVARALNALRQVEGITPEVRGGEIRKVGVVGAGLMGAGIATCFLGASTPTVMLDQTPEALERGRREVNKAFATLAKRGVVWEDFGKGIQQLLTTTTDPADLADCDLVIEAVFEKLDVKKAVFATLGQVVKQGTVLATNTSGLDVDAMAQASGRPKNVVGLHFFSPAFMMPMLEIVRGRSTSAEVLRTAMYASTLIRKTAIVVGNCPGFAANRSLEGYAREAEMLILEGLEPEQLDKILTGYGFPMGPCTMGDMAGVDIRLHYLEALTAGRLIPADPRYGAMTRALSAAGRLGQKKGAGNYDYGEDGRTPKPSPTVSALRDQIASELGVKQRQHTDEEVLMRCLLPIINEAAKILEEGIVTRATDIDLIWIYGYGFPAAKGGPVYQARLMGLDKIRSTLESFRSTDPKFGDAYWTPAPSLPRLFA